MSNYSIILTITNINIPIFTINTIIIILNNIITIVIINIINSLLLSKYT